MMPTLPTTSTLPAAPALPFRATLNESCAWLAAQTGSPWTLARLIEHGLTPWVWLDYDPAYPELFGAANGGYAAPIFYEGDIARLVGGSADVLITITKDAYKIVARLPEPGFRRRLDELRFLKKEVERLAGRLKHAAMNPASAAAPTAQESKAGLPAAQIVAAFAALVKFDLQAALDGAGGVFGDEGARIKGSARKGRQHAAWHPVTLALGLHEVHRVPLGPLKRAFSLDPALHPWHHAWEQSLRLLGK